MCCGACRRPTWRRPPTWCGPTSEGWRGICGMRWASTALHASGWLRFIWKGDYLRSRGGGLARLTWAVPVGCAGDEGDCDEVRHAWAGRDGAGGPKCGAGWLRGRGAWGCGGEPGVQWQWGDGVWDCGCQCESYADFAVTWFLA